MGQLPTTKINHGLCGSFIVVFGLYLMARSLFSSVVTQDVRLAAFTGCDKNTSLAQQYGLKLDSVARSFYRLKLNKDGLLVVTV